MANITYPDKSQGVSSTFPTDQTWRYQDANEVKTVVNTNSTQTDANTGNINVLQDGALVNKIVVNQSNVASTLGGTIDSTKEYFLDGVIDFTGVSIEVPDTGIGIMGYSFELSGIVCNDAAYTLFNSPVGGSGDVLLDGFFIQIDGVGSEVYGLVGDTGDEAIELNRVNFNDCTSLGSVENYRQGLETGTGRFGGMPELEFIGVWNGGYFIDTSIVRGLADGAYTLFKAGAGFTMASRFRSNANIDLPSLASFCDFAPANFVNSSTFQLGDCIVSRDGVFDASDSNIIPNISAGDLASLWASNVGIGNTHVGGTSTITVEIETVIAVLDTYVDLNGTFTASDLQHFDSPSNGQLRHLGTNPRDYEINVVLDVDGSSGDDLEISIQKWDDSGASFEEVVSQVRVVNNFQGGRNVAFILMIANTILDKDDFIKLQVRNKSSTDNVTAELGGYYIVKER